MIIKKSKVLTDNVVDPALRATLPRLRGATIRHAAMRLFAALPLFSSTEISAYCYSFGQFWREAWHGAFVGADIRRGLNGEGVGLPHTLAFED